MPRRAIINKKTLTRSVAAEEVIFFQTDATGTIISASDQLAEFTGQTIKELVGSSLLNLAGNNSKAELSTFLRKEKVAGRDTASFIIKGLKRNRSLSFLVEQIAGVNDGNFLLNWKQLPKTSVQHRRNNLPAIREMFGSNAQPVFILHEDTVIYTNHAASLLYGFSEQEITGLNFQEFIGNAEERSHASKTAARIRAKDGNIIPTTLFATTIVLGGTTHQIVFADEEKQIPHVTASGDSSAVHDSEAWKILDEAPEVIFKLDVEGNFEFVSKEFENVLGFSKASIKGKHFTTIVYPPDLDTATQGFADIFQFGRAKGNVIFRVVTANGNYLWVSTSGVFVYEEGRPVYCIGVAQNITEMKELLEKLEASEERYAAFIHHSSEAIWRFETNEPLSIHLPEEQLIKEFLSKGFLAECNDQMARLYGFEEASEITGAPLSDFISPGRSRNARLFQRLYTRRLQVGECRNL